MTHPVDGWRRIIPFAAILLLTITIFAVFYDPEPEATYFGEVSIAESVDWNTYRYDVQHRGLAPPDCTVDSGLELEWRTRRLNWREYSASKSSPAVDDENLYVGLDTGTLVAVDRQTGIVKWKFNTRFSKNGIHGSPTIDPERGYVYVGAYDGRLYAVDRETGRRVWSNKLGDYIGSSPTVYDGTVYIGVEMREPAGYIVGVDAGTGEEVFRSGKLGNHPHSTPTIDPGSGSIIIGENDGYLYCYWMGNQTERWRFKTSGAIKSTPSVNDGLVYITSWDGGLSAINITTGKSKWSFSSGFSSMSSPTVDSETGVVYFGNHAGYLYAVDSSHGDKVWEYKTGDKILSSPTLVKSTGTVLVGSKDGNVYLLNAGNGDLKQKIPLLSGLTGVPVTVGDHLYVFDHLGYLYSFR
ncbi:MAG: PQQ-binding-like beta-propeller repeat protein [Candidatus Bathyarchaeota archaeon]